MQQERPVLVKPQTAPPAAPQLPQVPIRQEPIYQEPSTIPEHADASSVPSRLRWPRLIRQPDCDPISEDQLTAEIKGIYAGLVIVEAKCINIDQAQAENVSTQLDKGQWQALIGLHRTLLYEHHDFLMATQHPSATAALRALPMKYGMPARMWRHGIHAFLEVLRHRRPHSQEYMLSFIYLAYQMMSLLYETVPIFLDTWIECLGDLARYRMAIEEEREPHAQWGGVATSWYLRASDRHPQVGRLYHHLAILERPSLRKFACYGKSLTCVVRFPNARDSLRTLCVPISEEAPPARPIGMEAEVSWCRMHSLLFLGKDESSLQDAYDAALGLLLQPDAFRWQDCGVALAIANISALLGHGATHNPLRTVFDMAIKKIVAESRPSNVAEAAPLHPSNIPRHDDLNNNSTNLDEERRLLVWSKKLTVDCFHTTLRCPPDKGVFGDSMAYVSVMICFLHFYTIVHGVIQNEPESHLSLCLALGMDEIDWIQLATYLNHLARRYPINAPVLQCAQRGIWPGKPGVSKPLAEDWSIRGLVWAFFEFCPGWFQTDEDEEVTRATDESNVQARAERILYYGLRLAFETPYLSYEAHTLCFSSSMQPIVLPHRSGPQICVPASQDDAAGASMPSPTTSARTASGSDNEFIRVSVSTKQNKHLTSKSHDAVIRAGGKQAKSTRPTKQRPSADNVRVFDPDAMDTGIGET